MAVTRGDDGSQGALFGEDEVPGAAGDAALPEPAAAGLPEADGLACGADVVRAVAVAVAELLAGLLAALGIATSCASSENGFANLAKQSVWHTGFELCSTRKPKLSVRFGLSFQSSCTYTPRL